MANAVSVPRSDLRDYIQREAQKTCDAAGTTVKVRVEADHRLRAYRVEMVSTDGRIAFAMVSREDVLRLGLPWTKDVLAAARSVAADAREHAAECLSAALRKAGIHA
jgi:hypothetical protein